MAFLSYMCLITFLSFRKKQEMMKKRKLTLEMRAAQRRKETESGQVS